MPALSEFIACRKTEATPGSNTFGHSHPLHDELRIVTIWGANASPDRKLAVFT